MKIDGINREKIIHVLAGGGISLVSIFFAEAILWLVMDFLLRTFGIYGILVYWETQEAFFLFRLGSVYFLSGFVGGLYVGYKIKEGLETIMIFPAIICILGIALLQSFTGYIGMAISTGRFSSYFIRDLLIPLSVLIAGSYLGGYTLNWHVEEEPEEERIYLIFEEQ